MHRQFRITERSDVCKENPCQVLCALLLPLAMDSLEIKVGEILKPINPRNLLVSSTQGQNNMQLWWIERETTLQIWVQFSWPLSS